MDPTAKQKKPEWLLEEDMLEELRDKLKQTQEELEAQREAEKRRQLQVGMERKRRGDCSWTTQETQEAPVFHRTRSQAGFQQQETSLQQGVSQHQDSIFLDMANDLGLSEKEDSVIFPDLSGHK